MIDPEVFIKGTAAARNRSRLLESQSLEDSVELLKEEKKKKTERRFVKKKKKATPKKDQQLPPKIQIIPFDKSLMGSSIDDDIEEEEKSRVKDPSTFDVILTSFESQAGLTSPKNAEIEN